MDHQEVTREEAAVVGEDQVEELAAIAVKRRGKRTLLRSVSLAVLVCWAQVRMSVDGVDMVVVVADPAVEEVEAGVDQATRRLYRLVYETQMCSFVEDGSFVGIPSVPLCLSVDLGFDVGLPFDERWY
jgi:hypothetical protein